eukprot:TRINITY_DN19358_c1_g1_i1.p1 TRINITY_DN19358_c1_g1~~TRINITY_DN19358_c1_g1_i1.p1  ORF type:complete len:555 (+),score=115.01 TRINITY_DN19358_c1_g1_i1:206-1870(+)
MGNMCGGDPWSTCCRSQVVTVLARKAVAFTIPVEWGVRSWELIGTLVDCGALEDKDRSTVLGKFALSVVLDQANMYPQLWYDIPTTDDEGKEDPKAAAKVAKIFEQYGEVDTTDPAHPRLLLKTTDEPSDLEVARKIMESPFDPLIMTSEKLLGLAAAVALIYHFDEDVYSPRGQNVTERGLRTSPRSGRIRTPEEQWQRIVKGDIQGLDSSDWIQTLRDQARMEPDTEFLQWVRTDAGLEAGLLMSKTRKSVYAIFRGTQGFTDVCTDLQIMQTDLNGDNDGMCCGLHVLCGCCIPNACHCCFHCGRQGVHSGVWGQFLSGLCDVAEDGSHVPREDGMLSVALRLLKENPGFTMVVSGHSLGGALATVWTHEVCRLSEPSTITICTTFGAPRVGNRPFVEALRGYEKEGRLVFWRVQNQDDAVARVPSLGYEHYGTLVWLQPPGQGATVHSDGDQPCLAELHPVCDPVFIVCCCQAFGQHSIEAYIESLSLLVESKGGLGMWRDYRPEDRKNNKRVARNLAMAGVAIPPRELTEDGNGIKPYVPGAAVPIEAG